MRPMNTLWTSYLEGVVDRGGLSQALELRRAFYAGADAILRKITIMLEREEGLTEDDLREVDELRNEIVAWTTPTITLDYPKEPEKDVLSGTG